MKYLIPCMFLIQGSSHSYELLYFVMSLTERETMCKLPGKAFASFDLLHIYQFWQASTEIAISLPSDPRKQLAES